MFPSHVRGLHSRIIQYLEDLEPMGDGKGWDGRIYGNTVASTFPVCISPGFWKATRQTGSELELCAGAGPGPGEAETRPSCPAGWAPDPASQPNTMGVISIKFTLMMAAEYFLRGEGQKARQQTGTIQVMSHLSMCLPFFLN